MGRREAVDVREQPNDDAPNDDIPVPVVFEGAETQCTICTEMFAHGDRVLRLSGRHMFHTHCWNNYWVNLQRQGARGTLNCPNCRGAGTIIAIWDYIDPM